MIVPIVAIAAIGMASFAAPPFSGIDKTPEVKGSVFFSMKNVPSGFSLVPGYDNSNLPELTGKQNPNPIKSSAGTCIFSPQVSYLPAAYAGRGDKYLTLSYIYENSQVSPTLPAPVKRTHVSAGKSYLEVLTSSYDIPASKNGKADQKGSYRTVAVRALDMAVFISYAGGPDSKGLPTITMTYDCQTASDYKDADFSALLASVDVNLTDTVSNAPVAKKETASPAGSATPSGTPTGSPSAPETPAVSPSKPSAASRAAAPTGTAETKSSPSGTP